MRRAHWVAVAFLALALLRYVHSMGWDREARGAVRRGAVESPFESYAESRSSPGLSLPQAWLEPIRLFP